MIQPEGTVTYKGHRKSKPGEESLIPSRDQNVVKKAGEFYEKGKAIEAGQLEEKKEVKEENKNLFNGEKE